MAAGYPLPKGPDKVLFCCARLVFITGSAGECKSCKKKMTVVAEFPAKTWESRGYEWSGADWIK